MQVLTFDIRSKTASTVALLMCVLLGIVGCGGGAPGSDAAPDAPRDGRQRLDTLRFDAIHDRVHPDTTQADLSKLDTTKPDLTKADTTRADLSKADTTKPDLTQADATQSDLTALADLAQADLAEPDASPPDGLVPDLLVTTDASGACVHPPVVKQCTSTFGWCTIPAGCYWMGSPVGEPCRGPNEARHRVFLTHSFVISATEVTRGDFQALMGYFDSPFTCGADCPAVRVSWHEAAAYCNALSAQKGLPPCYVDKGTQWKCTDWSDCSLTGACANGVCIDYHPAPAYIGTTKSIHECSGYRLPTEAEWEYAYRAGTTTAYYNGTNNPSACNNSCSTTDANADAIAWYECNWGMQLHAVGLKLPNAWGLHDMAGNVGEHCHDWYEADLGSSPVTDPTGPAAGLNRVVRGGHQFRYPFALRAAFRFEIADFFQGDHYGFRCVRSL